MPRSITLSAIFFLVFTSSCKSSNIDGTSIITRIKTIQAGKSNKSDRQYWRTQLKWSEECESGFNYPASVSGLDIFQADNNEFILQVSCTLGSYQGQHMLYLISPESKNKTFKVLELPQYEVTNKKLVKKKQEQSFWGEILNGSTYSALTVLNLYSGFGHCGTLTTYKLEGKRLLAVRFKSQPDCESQNREREPEKWSNYTPN